jgi:peptidoglycan/LPS O-acetylase OafA/YrhL
VVAAAGMNFPVSYFSDFLVGSILAMLFAENRIPDFSNMQAGAMVSAGLYLFCFSPSEDHFIHTPIKAMLPAGDTAHFVWALSAALIVMALLGNAALRDVFSKDWSVWLGRLSFPIYLLHVPIMLSAGAMTIVMTIEPLGRAGAVVLGCRWLVPCRWPGSIRLGRAHCRARWRF